MINCVLAVLCEIWLIAAGIHFVLPSGWQHEWYGLPLFFTFAAIVIGTGNYFIDRSFKKLMKD